MFGLLAIAKMSSSAIGQTLREQVQSYLAEYFFVKKEKLTDEVQLVDDLGADSLDLLQVVYTLNDMFDIQIKVDDLSRMLTVGGVCDVVCDMYQEENNIRRRNENWL